jgi:hypothetical protein
LHQTFCVRDQFSSEHFTDEGLKIWGNCSHALTQVVSKSFSEFNQLNNTFSPSLDLLGIRVFHVHTHANLGSVNDLLRFFFVKQN